jgi:iron complex transport system substrate-binding protein
MKRRKTLAAATVGVLLLAGCGTPENSPAHGSAASGGYPVTVDSCGRTFTYRQAPDRVVLGFPGTLSTLDALGVGGSVHGYVAGSFEPLPAGYPSRIVEVSPDYNPPREAVIAAKPDLFLSNGESQVTTDGAVSYDDLRGVGSHVYVLGGYCADRPAPRTIDVVYNDITALGSIFGVPEKATTLVTELTGKVTAAKEKVSGRSLRVAYVQVHDGKLYALSGYPGAAVISALGLTNEFGDLTENFAEISTEAALTRKPDVLVVSYVGDTRQKAVDDVKALLRSTPAAQNGRVFAVKGGDFESGGVAIVNHAVELADAIARP